MKRGLIACDLDGVLNNLNQVWLNRYNRDYNDNFTIDQWTSWHPEELIRPECGIHIFDYLTEPGFFSSQNLSPLPYAREATALISQYYDIRVVTAYIPESCQDKCEFIDTYYPWIGSKNVVFCNDKSIIRADYLIDDGPHNHELFTGTSIVFDYPYSRDTMPNAYHVSNWLEVLEVLRLERDPLWRRSILCEEF